jgi:hypothetical protein
MFVLFFERGFKAYKQHNMPSTVFLIEKQFSVPSVDE